jgi:hypothetical protein
MKILWAWHNKTKWFFFKLFKKNHFINNLAKNTHKHTHTRLTQWLFSRPEFQVIYIQIYLFPVWLWGPHKRPFMNWWSVCVSYEE